MAPPRILLSKNLFVLSLRQIADPILDDFQHILVFKDRISFMTRAEIKDFPFSQIPDTPAAEPFALLPAFLKDHLIRIGNVIRLIVYFRFGQLEFLRDSSGDGMVGLVVEATVSSSSWLGSEPASSGSNTVACSENA